MWKIWVFLVIRVVSFPQPEMSTRFPSRWRIINWLTVGALPSYTIPGTSSGCLHYFNIRITPPFHRSEHRRTLQRWWGVRSMMARAPFLFSLLCLFLINSQWVKLSFKGVQPGAQIYPTCLRSIKTDRRFIASVVLRGTSSIFRPPCS